MKSTLVNSTIFPENMDEAIINMCASFTIPKKSEGFKYVVNVLEDDIYKRYC